MKQLKPENVTQAVTALLSLTTAIYGGFRGRAKWEPHTQDIPKGSQRIAALISFVIISAILYFLREESYSLLVAAIMVVCGAGAYLGFHDYLKLTSGMTYDMIKIVDGKETVVKILGAEKEHLTTAAQEYLRDHPGETPQALVNGCGGDLDAVWHKDARSKTRSRYERDYIFLTSGGTIALACAGVLFSHVVANISS
jgi:hypothetical protein